MTIPVHLPLAATNEYGSAAPLSSWDQHSADDATAKGRNSYGKEDNGVFRNRYFYRCQASLVVSLQDYMGVFLHILTMDAK